jgi:phytanoyl-CoA dioxygenase PhyH
MIEAPELIDKKYLLDDDAMKRFITQGYHIVEVDFPPEFHESVCQQIDAVFERRGGNPLNEILEEVPDLYKVWEHPVVRGALISILGPDYSMNGHRHCHYTKPGDMGGHWHQDSVNVRHHQIRTLLGLYYPQDVTEEMGPTVILPGTQYHNTPTSLMSSYMNFKNQIPLAVKAGTVAITHYDIWHSWMPNTSKNRRMLKFLFDRTSEPTGPSWNAAPYANIDVNPRSVEIDDMTAAYKHRLMWSNIWRWLHGQDIVDEW